MSLERTDSMIARRWLAILAVALGAGLLVNAREGQARGDDKAPAADKKEQANWKKLFDGKSLAGWHKNPEKIGHGTGGIWQVEEGSITGEQDPPGSGNGGILLTDKKFGDFELLFPAAVLGIGIIDVPIRYRARTYGTTNISRFRHGLMLLWMTVYGFFRIKTGRLR